MMTTAQERLKILKMVQEGKISASEGAQLLNALSSSAPPKKGPIHRGASRWLRVRVMDIPSGKAKVNVNLPLRLVDAGMNIASQFVPDMGIEEMIDAVNEAIQDNLSGKIIDVIDEEDGEHIEVFIE
ncbi:MAG: hypothetical protein AB1345_08035 [Chloroflexota bacterium]